MSGTGAAPPAIWSMVKWMETGANPLRRGIAARGRCNSRLVRAPPPGPRRRRSVGGEHIALAAHGLQVARLFRVGLDLAAEAGDLHVDGAFLRLAAVAAQILDQPRAADRLAQVLGEDAHQLH